MLSGDTVGLRAIDRGDLPAIHRWMNDPGLWILQGGRPRLLPEEASERWFEVELDKTDPFDGRTLAICDLDGAILGTITFGRVDQMDRACEIGLYLGEPGNRNRGLGTAAIRLAVAYLFDQLGLNRIWLQVHSDNALALRCYEKVGFVREGVLRQSRFFNGRFHDFVVMSVLAGEWKKGVPG
jgi:RimJ/RimL family protein N-acetyltransferase